MIAARNLRCARRRCRGRVAVRARVSLRRSVSATLATAAGHTADRRSRSMLGSGKHGEVRKAIHTASGRPVCVCTAREPCWPLSSCRASSAAA